MKADKAEQKYIARRRRKAFLSSIPFFICRIFPVKKNKIVFWSFEGTRGYCCNPKYVADELIRRKKQEGISYELVWLAQKEEERFPKEIRRASNGLWSRAYHLSTAAVWVGNTRTFWGTQKRKKQTYIQTWHGTICIKPIGRYRGDLFPKIAEIVSESDSKLIDYVLSGSGWCDKYYRDGLLYDGEILRTGDPRCDILIYGREQMWEQIRTSYQLPQKANIVLYAPTFRGGSQSINRSIGTEVMSLSAELLLNSLERRFGGEWYLLLRLHPQLAARNQKCLYKEKSDRIIDVTMHQDMNELIAASDLFITDYSSSIFEAMLLKIPCFIYADDMEEYVRDRGDLFFKQEELPFDVAMTNEELEESICGFEEEPYINRVDAFMKKWDVVEDGHASERVADLIKNSYKGERA